MSITEFCAVFYTHTPLTYAMKAIWTISVGRKEVMGRTEVTGHNIDISPELRARAVIL